VVLLPAQAIDSFQYAETGTVGEGGHVGRESWVESRVFDFQPGQGENPAWTRRCTEGGGMGTKKSKSLIRTSTSKAKVFLGAHMDSTLTGRVLGEDDRAGPIGHSGSMGSLG
jgi:hypothetical protein